MIGERGEVKMRARPAAAARWLLAALVAGGFGAVASADVMVIRSDLDELARGDVLNNGVEIELGADQIVRIMAPNGATRTLTGPDRFRVGDLPGAASAPVEAYQRALAMLGGAGREDTVVLGAREAPWALLLNGVAFEAKDGFCYAPDQSVTIARLDAGGAAELRVTTFGFDPYLLQFEADQLEITVPASELFPRDGADYLLVLENGPTANVTARPTPLNALASEFAATTLIAEGCDTQFEAYLD